MLNQAGTLGLADLAQVKLPPAQEQALVKLRDRALGSGMWRGRMVHEVRELFALEQIAPRMTVLAVEVAGELRAIVRLVGAVPTLPPGAADIVVAHEVHLALRYPEEILRGPLPGAALVQVMAPQHVYHANVGSGPIQPLCLGANIARGFPLREAVLASYAALTLQAVTLDERDTAGVMHRDAALWWQANAARVPLSSAPFLAGVREEDAS